MGTHKEKMPHLALDIAIQQLLKSDYSLCGVRASELRSDARGVLGLRTACKQLAEHDARQWMTEMACCIAGSVDTFRNELLDAMRTRYGDDWDLDDYCWYKRVLKGRGLKKQARRTKKREQWPTC